MSRFVPELEITFPLEISTNQNLKKRSFIKDLFLFDMHRTYRNFPYICSTTMGLLAQLV